MRGKRKLRTLTVEAIPCPSTARRGGNDSLSRSLVELLVEMIQQKLKEGTLVVAGGVVRVSPEKVNHEQES